MPLCRKHLIYVAHILLLTLPSVGRLCSPMQGRGLDDVITVEKTHVMCANHKPNHMAFPHMDSIKICMELSVQHLAQNPPQFCA